jgi:hypothetical protein
MRGVCQCSQGHHVCDPLRHLSVAWLDPLFVPTALEPARFHRKYLICCLVFIVIMRGVCQCSQGARDQFAKVFMRNLEQRVFRAGGPQKSESSGYISFTVPGDVLTFIAVLDEFLDQNRVRLTWWNKVEDTIQVCTQARSLIQTVRQGGGR